jgi:hypothetical protein
MVVSFLCVRIISPEDATLLHTSSFLKVPKIFGKQQAPTTAFVPNQPYARQQKSLRIPKYASRKTNLPPRFVKAD